MSYIRTYVRTPTRRDGGGAMYHYIPMCISVCFNMSVQTIIIIIRDITQRFLEPVGETRIVCLALIPPPRPSVAWLQIAHSLGARDEGRGWARDEGRRETI